MTEFKVRATHPRAYIFGLGFIFITLALCFLGRSVFAQSARPAQIITNGDFEFCSPGVMTGAGTVTDFTFGSGGGATPPTFECRGQAAVICQTSGNHVSASVTSPERVLGGHARSIDVIKQTAREGRFSLLLRFSLSDS